MLGLVASYTIDGNQKSGGLTGWGKGSLPPLLTTYKVLGPSQLVSQISSNSLLLWLVNLPGFPEVGTIALLDLGVSRLRNGQLQVAGIWEI